MNLDDHLRSTLHDDRWALPVQANTLDRVRKRRSARRRRTVILTVAGCLAMGGGVLGLLLRAPSNATTTLGLYADGYPAGQPVPGISPNWTPTSGRDWLLDERQSAAFTSIHEVPTDGLFGSSRTVPSPAPISSVTSELRAYADGAGLPAECTFTSDEAYDRDARVSVLHVTLPNGAPVWLQRTRLSKPETVSVGPDVYRSDVNRVEGSAVQDIERSTSALVTYDDFHFGFGAQYNSLGPAHAVRVVTRGGVEWTWIGPHPVPLAQLKSWAIAAAQS